jgi:hypothetical protein
MRIGYSFWGFLGSGVLDTPDGGRSHRTTLVDGLVGLQRHIVFLQQNRDLDEAGCDLRDRYRWDLGLPSLDVLFLEWRWPIPGRNDTPCGSLGHTCDLHRQNELLEHYTYQRSTPTVIWDKDRRLPLHDVLRDHSAVTVCEAAWYPTGGAHTLLFPVKDAWLDEADPVALAATPRHTELVYVGNQYDRDEAFGRYFAPAAYELTHQVAGKWTRTDSWKHVGFTGRCSFEEVAAIYGGALATVLLLPERYEHVGQMTQRLFESILAGCIPLAPDTIRGVKHFSPPELHVHDADDVVERVQAIARAQGTSEHAHLIEYCLAKLEPFRASHQLAVLDQILVDASGGHGG